MWFRHKRIPVLLVLLTLLSACGFHLRGSVVLPPVLEVTFIESKNPYGDIAPALRLELRSAGAQLTEERQESTAVLRIHGNRSDRRVLSVGSSGRAKEYELFEEVRFSLVDPQGATLVKAQTMRAVRDLVFDENELLGKVTEAEDIRREMRRSLARQIINRIAVETGTP